MHDPYIDRQRGETYLDQQAARLRSKIRLVTPEDPYEPDPDVSPESCGIDSDADWKADMIRKINKSTGDSTFPCRAHNLILILENDANWKGRLRFDAFRQQFTVDQQPWSDSATIELKAWLERHWIEGEVKTATVYEAVEAVAYRHAYHPVKDYLIGLVWDGIERCSTFFSDFCGTPLTPYSEAVARSLFISAVARMLTPGCKVDTMIVLEGAQGIGKSKLVQALFATDWHMEITEAPGGLDFYQSLRGKWIGEFAELSAFGKTDQNRIKQALSSTSDTYRASYARHAATYLRQFIFIGNTNRKEYLADETGARRYLPITCTEIYPDAVASIRDQLWAEAVVRFHRGEKWWEIPDAEREQDARYQQDAWEEVIADWLRGRQKVTVSEVMNQCLELKIERQGRSEQTRVGHILHRLQWHKKQASSGDRHRFYVPP